MDAFWNRALMAEASSFEPVEDDYIAPVNGGMMMQIEPVEEEEVTGKGKGGKGSESMGKGEMIGKGKGGMMGKGKGKGGKGSESMGKGKGKGGMMGKGGKGSESMGKGGKGSESMGKGGGKGAESMGKSPINNNNNNTSDDAITGGKGSMTTPKGTLTHITVTASVYVTGKGTSTESEDDAY